MKKYYADTNIFLRLLIQDNLKQTEESKRQLLLAKKRIIKIYVISEIIPEIEYVLRKVYKVPKDEVVIELRSIVNTTYLAVEKRLDWLEAIGLYQNYNVDLVDALLAASAKKSKFEILSFDKDFKKLSKIIK